MDGGGEWGGGRGRERVKARPRAPARKTEEAVDHRQSNKCVLRQRPVAGTESQGQCPQHCFGGTTEANQVQLSKPSFALLLAYGHALLLAYGHALLLTYGRSLLLD